MTDIEKIRADLEEQLAELTTRAVKIDDDLSQPGDVDWEEHATEAEDDEVLEEVGKVSVEEIHQIRQALTRIDEGNYGVCSKCGGPIGKERLEAIPYALNCVKCS